MCCMRASNVSEEHEMVCHLPRCGDVKSLYKVKEFILGWLTMAAASESNILIRSTLFGPRAYHSGGTRVSLVSLTHATTCLRHHF